MKPGKIKRKSRIENYLARRDRKTKGKNQRVNFMIEGTSGIVATLIGIRREKVDDKGKIMHNPDFANSYVLRLEERRDEDGAVSGIRWGFLYPVGQKKITIEERKGSPPLIKGNYTSGRFPMKGEQI